MGGCLSLSISSWFLHIHYRERDYREETRKRMLERLEKENKLIHEAFQGGTAARLLVFIGLVVSFSFLSLSNEDLKERRLTGNSLCFLSLFYYGNFLSPACLSGKLPRLQERERKEKEGSFQEERLWTMKMRS